MSLVFVIDQEKQPLDPIPPGRARFLLRAGHAAVWRRYPFTLILTDRTADAQTATPAVAAQDRSWL
jgi:RRXRR protein